MPEILYHRHQTHAVIDGSILWVCLGILAFRTESLSRYQIDAYRYAPTFIEVTKASEKPGPLFFECLQLSSDVS